MKHAVVLAVWLVPAAAFAQSTTTPQGTTTYTNADLVKFQVPGAFTNADLKRLPATGVTVLKAPAVKAAPRGEAEAEEAPAPLTDAYQAYYSNVRADRDVLAAELAYEIGLVEFSESAFAGDTRSFDVRLGYRSQAAELIRELTKRVALLDARLDSVADEARKAGVVLDRR